MNKKDIDLNKFILQDFIPYSLIEHLCLWTARLVPGPGLGANPSEHGPCCLKLTA